MSRRKSRELLLTLVPHTHIFSNSYLPSVQSWHRPNSVSAHEASTSSSVPSPPTPPAGKQDGHSAGWLSGPLCSPNIPQSLLPLFQLLTRGFAFHFPPWCVTLCCRFVFNMCDRIHLTGSERKWEDFLWSNSSYSTINHHERGSHQYTVYTTDGMYTRGTNLTRQQIFYIFTSRKG